MTEISDQGRFAGVTKIILFNVQFYIVSAAILVAACLIVASKKLPPWLALAVLCGAALVAFWVLSSILVSWYVYDYVGVTRWRWLRDRISVPIERWANIHGGLDESTSTLRLSFPGTEGSVIDIFCPAEMTERSIARARRIHPSSEPNTPGRYDALPLPADDRDTVFLLFAAHELRVEEHRTKLLRECARILRKTGHVVMVEHLRDWKNFLAFGPGFLHFYSRQNWQHTTGNAGLQIEQESQITPFVRCFVLRRAER